jgi:GTP cyclohydrolase I
MTEDTELYNQRKFSVNNTGTPMSVKIKEQLENAGIRYFANDNISQFLDDESRALLINEVEEKFDGVLRSLLIDVDNDPNSHGTARRLAKMYINEIMSGRYFNEPASTSFPNDGSHGTEPYHGMLVVRVELKSMCSHHHQPVTGTAYIGVIPSSHVIGLSKYIRIAQHCARRGTLQEELCGDIAKAISKATKSNDVGVYIEAKHGCCENRGIMASNSMTQTAVLLGDFLTDASVKNEFYSNIKLQTSRYNCN